MDVQLTSCRASGRLCRFRITAAVEYEKVLFNFILDNPKPLFRAGCSLSPVLNLSFHFVGSVFGRSELHGKFMGKAHSAIAVFFRKVGRRSNLSNDGFPRLIYLRDFILRFFFGHKFEHLFGCVIGMLNHTKGPFAGSRDAASRIPCVACRNCQRRFRIAQQLCEAPTIGIVEGNFQGRQRYRSPT